MRCLCALERQRRDHPPYRVMTKAKPLPPVELVRELLDYDQETGLLTWRSPTANQVKPGDIAGGLCSASGYIKTRVRGRRYLAHRIAWLHATGRDPLDRQIDHIDGNRANNRFANLREASVSQNHYNAKRRSDSRSGYKGVSLYKQKSKWQAIIGVEGKRFHLGYFDTPELAHMAYAKAAAELHGDFARAA